MIYRLRKGWFGTCVLQSCTDAGEDGWEDHPYLGIGRDIKEFKILSLDAFETLLADAERGRKADKRAQQQAHARMTRRQATL